MTEDADALDYRALLDESLAEFDAIAKGRAQPHAYRVELTTTRDATAQPPAAMTGPDVVDLRESFEVSQALFAKMLNVSVSLVRAWERSARAPEGAALRLLEIAKETPACLLAKLTPIGGASGQPVAAVASTPIDSIQVVQTWNFDSTLGTAPLRWPNWGDVEIEFYESSIDVTDEVKEYLVTARRGPVRPTTKRTTRAIAA